jgi:hypothetical protein
MSARQVHRRIRAAALIGTAATTVVGLGLAGPLAAPAHANPLPAAFSGSAHADLVNLPADVLDTASARVPVGHAATTADSTAPSGNVTASGANLDADLLGLPITVDDSTVTAPPSAATSGPLAPIAVPSLASLGLITSDVEANYVSATACPPAVGTERLLGRSTTSVASLSLLGGVADVGAVQATTTTKLVDANADGHSDMVSETSTSVGDVRLLTGVAGGITVRVSDDVVTRATSDGTTGTAAVVTPNLTADVIVAGLTVATVQAGGGMVDVPITLGLANVSLKIGLADFTDSSSGAIGQGALDAVLRIQLTADLLGSPLADLELAVGAGNVVATAPAGGVECGALDPAATVITAPTDASTVTDPTPVITGTAEPSSTISLVIDNATPVTVSVDGTGNWTHTPTTDLTNGSHTVTVDGDANGAGIDDSVTFTVDAAAPTVITAPTDASTITDPTPVITGTSEPSSTISLVIDNATPVTVSVDGTGNWTHTPTTDLTNGPHTVTVDGDANGAGIDDSVTFTIDAAATDTDTDGDGVPDSQEAADGTDPGNPDTDGDGLNDGAEKTAGTDPKKPDTDGDGLKDGQEVFGPTGCVTAAGIASGTNPLKRDTDGDGLTDGQEVKGMDVAQKYWTVRGKPRKSKARTIGLVHTNPCAQDTDGDRLTDFQEVTGSRIGQRIVRSNANGGPYRIKVRKTDPTRADTDRDKLSDYDEVTGARNTRFAKRKSDPTLADTDWGGGRDGAEVRGKSDPSRHG